MAKVTDPAIIRHRKAFTALLMAVSEKFPPGGAFAPTPKDLRARRDPAAGRTGPGSNLRGGRRDTGTVPGRRWPGGHGGGH